MPMNVILYSFEDVEEVLSADITPEITDVPVGPVGPMAPSIYPLPQQTK